MQWGLILFWQSERNQPLAQIHSLAHKLSRGAVTQNLFSGRDKGRDVPTAPRDGCAGRQRQKELPRVTHESLRRKSLGHSLASGEPGQKASKQGTANIYSPV